LKNTSTPSKGETKLPRLQTQSMVSNSLLSPNLTLSAVDRSQPFDKDRIVSFPTSSNRANEIIFYNLKYQA